MKFVEKRLSGMPSPTLHDGDDLLEMGADIIMDEKGELLYVFHQQAYTDRPEAEELLQVIRDHK